MATVYEIVQGLSQAASNMYDRLVHGFVIDYIHLLPASYFNIADVFIGVGIIALMFMKPKVCRV